MRPPIFQWKVMLALVVIVGIGVTLGSVFRPVSKPRARGLAEYGPSVSFHLQSMPQTGKWKASYVNGPIPAGSKKQLWQQQCAALSAQPVPSHASKEEGALFRQMKRHACRQAR